MESNRMCKHTRTRSSLGRAGAGHLSHQRRRPPDVAAGAAISGGLLVSLLYVLFFRICLPNRIALGSKFLGACIFETGRGRIQPRIAPIRHICPQRAA